MISLPTCPICSKPVPPATDPNSSYSPFCSKRCKQVDLMRWCDGKYSIVESLDARRMAEIEEDQVITGADEDYSESEL